MMTWSSVRAKIRTLMQILVKICRLWGFLIISLITSIWNKKINTLLNNSFLCTGLSYFWHRVGALCPEERPEVGDEGHTRFDFDAQFFFRVSEIGSGRAARADRRSGEGCELWDMCIWAHRRYDSGDWNHCESVGVNGSDSYCARTNRI
jgi:hypothetical protein